MTNSIVPERALREFFDGNEVLKTLAETQQLHTQMLQTLLKAISPPADNDARLVEAIERLHAAVSQQTQSIFELQDDLKKLPSMIGQAVYARLQTALTAIDETD